MSRMVRPWIALLVALGLAGGCSRPVPAPPARGPLQAPARVADALVPPQPTLRLPKNFVPTGYAARLEIDPAKDTFGGSIAIAGVIDQPTTVIWLHGRRLAVARATATKGSEEVALRVTPRGEDLLEVRAAQPLDPGAWTLMLDYAGELELRSTAGAFKQTVGEHAYVYTQLEAVYARRVFPCVDEPDVKVPWKLTLDVPSRLVAVANTPTRSEAPIGDGKKRVEFAPSKPLPSYLVAFGVGPFEIVDAGTSRRGTPVRILTLARRAADAAYAAKTSARLLDLAEDWFGTPYPYEKLDLLTIPLTIGFGAMENAGLITFTRDADPPRSAGLAAAQERVGGGRDPRARAPVVRQPGHDGVLGRPLAQRGLRELGRAADHHPVRAGVARRARRARDPQLRARRRRPGQRAPDPPADRDGDDILNVFDRHHLRQGRERAQHVRALPRRRGVPARRARVPRAPGVGQRDLGRLRGRARRDRGDRSRPRRSAASSITRGRPEITATVACTGTPAVALAQRRYVPPGAPTPQATPPWIVPVCVAYERAGKRAEACTLLDGPTGTIALETKACPRWVMPNVDGRGYYRSAYTTAQLVALRDEAWPLLAPTERRAIFFDVREAVSTGRLPLAVGLTLVPKLLAGGDRHAIRAALGLPLGLDPLVPAALRPRYEHWLRQTFGPSARAAGLTPRPADSLDVEASRSALVAAVAWSAREPALIAEAVALGERWRELPQAIRGGVLAVAVDADPARFEQVLGEIVTEPSRARRQEMFHALAAVRDRTRQGRALALILDPAVDVRETLWMLRASSDEAGRALARAFFRANQDAIFKRLPLDATTGQIANLSALFTGTCAADKRGEIVDYVTRTFSTIPGSARVLAQNIEAMDQCIARRAALAPEVEAWLRGVPVPRARR